MSNQTESAIEFMSRMHGELAKKYEFRGQQYADLCASIAIITGKKLLYEARFPQMKVFIAPSTRTKQLVPIRYRTVSWERHYVCVCEGEAWDPILGKPEPVHSYSQALFGEQLPLQPHWSTEQLREFDEKEILIDFY